VGNRTVMGEKAPALWRRACKETFANMTEGSDLDVKRLIASERMRGIHPFLERVKAVTFKRSLLVLQQWPDGENQGHSQQNALFHNPAARRPQETQHSLAGPVADETLALGPYSAKKGDIVAIIYGCSVPLVLRMFKCKSLVSEAGKFDYKRFHQERERVKWRLQDPPEIGSDEDVYFEFVGECYVHGMMDGEAWKAAENWRNTKEFALI
jgi:hypothetical protein